MVLNQIADAGHTRSHGREQFEGHLLATNSGENTAYHFDQLNSSLIIFLK